MFLDITILLGEAVLLTNTIYKPYLLHLDKKIVIMADGPFFGHILNAFIEGSNSVHLSERLATLIMILEEHWENDKISFQNCLWAY